LFNGRPLTIKFPGPGGIKFCLFSFGPVYDEAYLKEKIENVAGKDTVQFVRIDKYELGKNSICMARVAMKKKEFGEIVIEREFELKPLKVEWYIPHPDRNAEFGDNSRTSTTNTSVSSGDELKLLDNTNPLNDQIQQMIQYMDQPLMQGSIPQGFNNNFGLSNNTPITNPSLYNMMNPIASLFNNPGLKNLNGNGIVECFLDQYELRNDGKQQQFIQSTIEPRRSLSQSLQPSSAKLSRQKPIQQQLIRKLIKPKIRWIRFTTILKKRLSKQKVQQQSTSRIIWEICSASIIAAIELWITIIGILTTIFITDPESSIDSSSVQPNVNHINSTYSLPHPPDLPFILPPELQFNHQIDSQFENLLPPNEDERNEENNDFE
ncbi:MAG: hypothetical protein EZS28_020805, partial [Streblomastix strix]